MLTEYDFTVVHLFKYIFNVGPSAVDTLQAQRLIWHCIWAMFGVRVRLLTWIKGVVGWERVRMAFPHLFFQHYTSGFSQHECFSEKNSTPITNFLNYQNTVGLKSYKNMNKTHINFK